MSRLRWDDADSRLFEAGVDRGVLYLAGNPGLGWNGLVSVSESTENADQSYFYLDGQKINRTLSLGTWAADVEAITYPDPFAEYDGTKGLMHLRARRPFGFTYRTLIGNDTSKLDRGYKVHIVYNCLAQPKDLTHNSLDASSDIANFSWSFTSTPVDVNSSSPSAHLIADSTLVNPGVMSLLEDMLYGSPTSTPYLPTTAQVYFLFEAYATVIVTDNGDGTATISGPDSAVSLITSDTALFNYPGVSQLDTDNYILRSF